MSADRYNRLVAYLNSPERATLWEHRRNSSAGTVPARNPDRAERA